MYAIFEGANDNGHCLVGSAYGELELVMDSFVELEVHQGRPTLECPRVPSVTAEPQADVAVCLSSCSLALVRRCSGRQGAQQDRRAHQRQVRRRVGRREALGGLSDGMELSFGQGAMMCEGLRSCYGQYRILGGEGFAVLREPCCASVHLDQSG